MGEEKGIPKDILNELDVKKQEKEEQQIVTATVEGHQVKLPVPASIRLEIDFVKGQKLKVFHDKEKKQIIYKL